MEESVEILQIIPAAGWQVAYSKPEPKDYYDALYTCPLVGWALIRDGAATRVEGLKLDTSAQSDVKLVDSTDDFFVGYVPDSTDLRELRDRARATWKRAAEKRNWLGRVPMGVR